ncbi:MAG: hypothetical protein WCW44_00275 [archaeon]|jgi:hypothetical protein
MAKSVYVTALIATIAIVLVVLLSVRITEDGRLNQINEEVKQISLESELQSAYEDFDTNNKAVYCTVLEQNIKSTSNRLSALEKTLQNFKSNSFSSDDFYFAKRSYLITSMVLFRNFQKAQVSCDLNMKTVLFFYAEDKSCEFECGLIGTQLNELSKTCKSFRDFHFPYNWESYDFTKILEVKYDVNKAGTLVIDGQTFYSAMSINELSKKLGCS